MKYYLAANKMYWLHFTKLTLFCEIYIATFCLMHGGTLGLSNEQPTTLVCTFILVGGRPSYLVTTCLFHFDYFPFLAFLLTLFVFSSRMPAGLFFTLFILCGLTLFLDLLFCWVDFFFDFLHFYAFFCRLPAGLFFWSFF